MAFRKKCGGVLIALLFILKVLVMGHCRKFLCDDESPSTKVGKMRIVDEEEIVEEGAPCHVKYQVMKRVVGTCIKLSKSSRRCVAGNYLHPLHPECM